jgi:hypothetical protein
MNGRQDLEILFYSRNSVSVFEFPEEWPIYRRIAELAHDSGMTCVQKNWWKIKR